MFKDYTNYSSATLYNGFTAYLKKISDLKYAGSVLQWDQETYLPPKGALYRGKQLATLSELAHKMFVKDKFGYLLQKLSERKDLSSVQQKNVSLTLEDYLKVKKFTPAFVRKMSETVSAAYHAWLQARKQNDFQVFLPHLAKLITLKRQEAETLGYGGHPYDALMNEHERGATVNQLDTVFDEVLPVLKQLIHNAATITDTDSSFLRQYFPKQEQWQWGKYLAKKLGFDFTAGRQDVSEHPFSINFCNSDVRITTRIDEHDFANMTWSTIHETGHGLYEQGLPASGYGLPSGEYTSLGIHESQSRLWENCVGRSLDFWTYYYPGLQRRFPQQFTGIKLPFFYKAINKIEPSLIRTEADEVTYHSHVIIRYELEKRLITGELAPADIPYYWNSLYKSYLDIDVPDDKNGCLQDVHWSHGSFGYFVTYSIGSFYAAQFWKQANIDIPALQPAIMLTGDTSLLLGWLRKHVHAYGRLYTSNELCKRITGTTLDANVFVAYINDKIAQLQMIV